MNKNQKSGAVENIKGRVKQAAGVVTGGISGDVVAKSLGHENFGVTTDHYAGAGAVADAAAARVAEALK